jgi:long-chain acyl-CoA synthetase
MPSYHVFEGWDFEASYNANSDLIEMPEITNQFTREIREINSSLGEHEHIKRFRLVTEEWSTQTGELSPTLKLRRNLIASKYKEVIADIYSKSFSDVNVVLKIKNGINGLLKNLPKFWEENKSS